MLRMVGATEMQNGPALYLCVMGLCHFEFPAVIYVSDFFPSHAKNMMSILKVVNKTRVLYYSLHFSFVREVEHLFICLRVMCIAE